MKQKNCDYFLYLPEFIAWRLYKTDTAEAYWSDYIAQHPNDREALLAAIEKFEAVGITQHQLSESDKVQLYHRVVSDAKKEIRSKKKSYYIWMSSAAAILAMAIIMFFPKQEPTFDNAGNSIIGEKLPVKSIQLISDGQVIELEHDAEIEVSEEGILTVNKHAEGKTIAKINKLIVPYGNRSTLILPDGSKVWANSGTEIHFPSVFSENTRDITVIGEVYVDVVHNKDKPFRVHTSHIDVEVYGTKFNVSDYMSDIKTSVVLEEGSVGVRIAGAKPVMLSPNEMFSINNGLVKIDKVNVREFTSWKDGLLIANNTSMTELLEKIGRYYNIEFENLHSTDLSNMTCSGKLVLADDIDSIMVAISALANIKYEKHENNIYITTINN